MELRRAQNDLRCMTTRANDAEQKYLDLKSAAEQRKDYSKPPQDSEPPKPTPKVSVCVSVCLFTCKCVCLCECSLSLSHALAVASYTVSRQYQWLTGAGPAAQD